MATADIVSQDASRLFFCHACSREVYPKLPDFLCSQCDSGAIEELDEEQQQQSQTSEATNPEADFIQNVFAHLTHPRPQGRRQVSFHSNSRRNHGPFRMGPAAFPSQQGLDFAPFIQQLFSNLGVPVVQASVNGVNIDSLGDYAWGPNGLDNIITQLLNQLENTGAPPAEKNKIESLPIVTITLEDVEKHSDCAVCREEYSLEERVKRLPCGHLFHPDCVDPWLEMHDSCPICRCNLNGEYSKDDDRPNT